MNVERRLFILYSEWENFEIEAGNANGVGKMDMKLELELELKLEREVEGVAASFD